MSNILQLTDVRLPWDMVRDTNELDKAIIAAIDKASDAELPLAVIVALLHAHALQQTNRIIAEE